MLKLSTPWPRNLIALIGTIIVVPCAVLLFLGWRVVDQDRILEEQQIRENLERSADVVVAAIDRAITTSEQRLSAGEADWPEGAVTATFRDGHIDIQPKGRVAYAPVTEPLREAPSGVFAEAEALEFLKRDSAAAIESYRALAKSADRANRAGALMRLGRNLGAIGEAKAALDVYATLSEMDDVATDSVPAALVGRYARCEVFDRLKRSGELRDEAQLLSHDLESGRWVLTAPVYLLYARDAAAWTGREPAPSSSALRFSQAMAALWERRNALAASGRESFAAENVDVVWQKSNREMRVLFVTPEFVRSNWLATASTVAQQQRISFRPGDVGAADAASVLRRARDTNLPWNLSFSSTSPLAQRADFLRRRRLLIAGFGLLITMTLAASYLIVRAVGRELAVARLQSDFVAAVSHEFRTPLTTLRQFTDMLRDNERAADDPAKQRRLVSYEAQSRATERLTRLVESLLDFGRMEAQAYRYAFAEQDCSEIVDRAVEDFRPEAKSAGCDVTFRRNGSVPVNVDREALSRAIRNLLENAVKYSPDHHSVEVSLAHKDRSVRIGVRDHGIGIPSDERRKIFTKFHRGEQAQKRGIKGTGIGLAMVDEIVKAHRGRVEVESEFGKGSTFTIVLPTKES